MSELNVIDCFCGAGGLSLGFKNKGFNLLFSYDNDQAAVETHRRNLGSHCYLTNATEVSKKFIEDKIEKSLNDVKVIVGGPPCQGFSVQRRGNDYDSRNNLVLEFLRLVLEIKPEFFVMENVGGLLSKRGKPYIQELNKRCDKAKYALHIKKLNAFDYGVPQNRKRVIIVGERMKSALSKFSFPLRTRHQNNAPATVREAIYDLIDKTEKEIVNHRADKLSEINLQRIRHLEEGQGRDSLPEELLANCHKQNNNHRHLDVYGRMAWDKPSPTITARFDSFSRGRFGHPELDRSITLREGARLQGFPDDFIFFGTKVQVAKQVGNAVPPPLAEALALQIKKHL